MSTKNLARTVIEGGRAPRNRFDRHYSNAQERSLERVVSARLVNATDFDDVVYPRRKKVYRGFADKLSPAERWLRSQTGRPWSKIRSELFSRFDTRTTAGRHVLFDHILHSVDDGSGTHRTFAEFRVDAHGILREPMRRRKIPRIGGR